MWTFWSSLSSAEKGELSSTVQVDIVLLWQKKYLFFYHKPKKFFCCSEPIAFVYVSFYLVDVTHLTFLLYMREKRDSVDHYLALLILSNSRFRNFLRILNRNIGQNAFSLISTLWSIGTKFCLSPPFLGQVQSLSMLNFIGSHLQFILGCNNCLFKSPIRSGLLVPEQLVLKSL